jgi:hypothetical protein
MFWSPISWEWPRRVGVVKCTKAIDTTARNVVSWKVPLLPLSSKRPGSKTDTAASKLKLPFRGLVLSLSVATGRCGTERGLNI